MHRLERPHVGGENCGLTIGIPGLMPSALRGLILHEEARLKTGPYGVRPRFTLDGYRRME